MSLLTALAPALLPAAIDAVKSVFGGLGRKIGGLSVDDEIKLDMAAVEKLRALAELDTPVGNPSQWVVNLRSSFRYVAAGGLILIGSAVVIYGITKAAPEVIALGAEMVAAPFSFIFGERLYFGMKGMKK